MKIFFLLSYSISGPSSRYRYYNLFPFYKQMGINFSHSYFFGELYIKWLVSKKNNRFLLPFLGGYYLLCFCKRVFITTFFLPFYDTIIIERDLLPRVNVSFYLKWLKSRGKRIIFEFDDLIEQTVIPKNKYFELLEIADGVIVGNNFLREMAGRHCAVDKIKVINTTIPFGEYLQVQKYVQSSKITNKIISIVWIGSATTMTYLEGMLNYFEHLPTKKKYKLVVISNSPPSYISKSDFPLNIEFIKWDVTTYLVNLANSDIGIMPLFDDDWARAKCGFKIIQYFGVGIPVVTSPLGINLEIVDHGINGFFATSRNEWRKYLEQLIDDGKLRLQMGQEGQKKVQHRFDNEKIHKDIVNFYRSLSIPELSLSSTHPMEHTIAGSDADAKKMEKKFADYVATKLIVCPNCEGDLSVPFLTTEVDRYKCCSCDKEYPVNKSITRFVNHDNYAQSFGLQWNYHTKTQIDKFSGLSISKDRLISESKWNFEDLRGELILECGSGAGRFSGPLCESGANVISFDYSNSVEVNWLNNFEFSNLLLIQASLYEMPFKKESFDRLLCLGVIQHTPNVEKSFKTLFKYLKPGGKFCVDVYAAPYSYLHPRHLMRPITKKTDPEKLYKFVRWYVPKLFPLSTFLHNIPWIGQYLARIIPVANWRSNLKLRDDNMWLEWAILDTFDWLSPIYESPQTLRSLKKWCRELDLSSWEISRERGLYIIRGVK